MNDPLLECKDVKWCNSNPLNIEELQQIKNEILLPEDEQQLKSEFAACMYGDGNHISENSSLVNLVTVVEGDGEMQRVPSENALLPLKCDTEDLFEESTKNESKEFQNLNSETEPEPVIEDSKKNDSVDVLVRTVSSESIVYSEKSSTIGSQNSKISVISSTLVTVPLPAFCGDVHKDSKKILSEKGLDKSEDDSVDSGANDGEGCLSIFNCFKRLRRRSAPKT